MEYIILRKLKRQTTDGEKIFAINVSFRIVFRIYKEDSLEFKKNKTKNPIKNGQRLEETFYIGRHKSDQLNTSKHSLSHESSEKCKLKLQLDKTHLLESLKVKRWKTLDNGGYVKHIS